MASVRARNATTRSKSLVVIFLVGDLPAIPVEVSLAGPPAGGIPGR